MHTSDLAIVYDCIDGLDVNVCRQRRSNFPSIVVANPHLAIPISEELLLE